MESERYTIPGITGIELRLPIAGPGSRSYAFLIDWHIRLVLALSWLAAAMYLEFGRLGFSAGMGGSEATAVFTILVPALVIYFFYHPVLELLMRGQSPGKRMAGVRIVTVEGGIPGAGAVLIRNIFRLIDCLPSFYFVGLMATFFSAQRVRIGDMAAGTLLVMDERTAAKYFERGASPAGLDVATLDLIEQILERWPSLAVEKRVAIARALLKKSVPEEGVDALSDEALRKRLASLAGGSA